MLGGKIGLALASKPINSTTTLLGVCPLFSIFCVLSILFYTMMLTTLHSPDDVNSGYHPLIFAFMPWFDSRYVLDNNIIALYIRHDNLFDKISLFAVDCDDFRRMFVCWTPN